MFCWLCPEKHSLVRFRLHPFLLLRNNLYLPWMAEGSSSCICQTAAGILGFWIWPGCHVHNFEHRLERSPLQLPLWHLRELQMFRAACARVKWGLVLCSRGSLFRWVFVSAQGDVSGLWVKPSWLYATLDMERQKSLKSSVLYINVITSMETFRVESFLSESHL